METNAMFKIGDRVRYTSGKHGNSDYNPQVGKEHECGGTIIKTMEGMGYPFRVRWDNGKENVYAATDLSHENQSHEQAVDTVTKSVIEELKRVMGGE